MTRQLIACRALVAREMANPLERTSVQLLLVVAAIAVFANSAVDRTDDGLPWEITLAGFCVFAIVFAAIYARKIEVALSIIRQVPVTSWQELALSVVRSQSHRSWRAHVFRVQL